MGPIALHGGGEFLPGDEAFLDSLLDAAAVPAALRAAACGGPAGPMARSDEGGREARSGGLAVAETEPIRVVIVPTAAARGRPDLAAGHGVAAFRARAAATGRSLRIDVAKVVDAAAAWDPGPARLIAAADLVHLPGGDPDLVPTILAGTAAEHALLAARARGAVVAGASAGAMAMAEWSWTPAGGIRGLGYVHGLVVVPHYDDVRRTSWQSVLDRLAPDGIGYLGLDERTGVIGGPGGVWRVAGAGAAHWFAAGTAVPIVARHGETLPIGG